MEQIFMILKSEHAPFLTLKCKTLSKLVNLAHIPHFNSNNNKKFKSKLQLFNSKNGLTFSMSNF